MQLYKLADEQWHFQKHWPMLLLLESGDPQCSAHSRLKDENSTSAQAWTERSTSSEGATKRAVSSARAGTESARRGQRSQQPSAGSAGARHPWDAAHGAPRLLPPTTGGPGRPRSGFWLCQRDGELLSCLEVCACSCGRAPPERLRVLGREFKQKPLEIAM